MLGLRLRTWCLLIPSLLFAAWLASYFVCFWGTPWRLSSDHAWFHWAYAPLHPWIVPHAHPLSTTGSSGSVAVCWVVLDGKEPLLSAMIANGAEVPAGTLVRPDLVIRHHLDIDRAQHDPAAGCVLEWQRVLETRPDALPRYVLEAVALRPLEAP